MKLPLRLKVYVTGVTVLAVSAAIVTLALYPAQADLVDIYYALALGGMIAVARWFPLQVAPKTKVLVDTSAIVAAVLLLSPGLAVGACFAGKVLGQAGSKGPLAQKIFNSSSAGLQAAIAAMVFYAVRQGHLVDNLTANIGPILLTSMVLYASNLALVEGIVSLQLRRKPFYRWYAMHKRAAA